MPEEEPTETTERVDLLLEGSTMALYVSIILLGALVTVGKGESNRELLALVWGTTIGLVVAHFFAFRIASRLHRGFAAHRGDLLVAYAQVLGGCAVAVLCSIPVLLFGEEHHADAVRFTLTLLLGVAGYMAGRAGGSSRIRSLMFGVGVAVAGIAVAAIKYGLSH